MTDPSGPSVPLPSESGLGTSSMGQEPIIQMDQSMSNMSSESEFESDLVGTATNLDEAQYPVIGNLEVSNLFSPETLFESSQLGRKLKRTFENVAGQKRTKYEKQDLEGALKVLIEESDFDGIVDLFERISSQAGIQINRIFNIDIANFEKSILILILLGQYIARAIYC